MKRPMDALIALRAYPSYDNEDLQTSVVDLLADLMHLSDERDDLHFPLALASAREHYRDESGVEVT